MVTTFIFDFSRVILFPKDKSYAGGLNALHDKLSQQSDYRFHDHFELNEPLLAFLETLKGMYDLYIFTTGHIQDVPEVRSRISQIFKAVYSVENIPFDKKDPQGYLFVAKELNLKPKEVLYIDDKAENITVAQQAGFKTILFQSNQQLIKELRSL